MKVAPIYGYVRTYVLLMAYVLISDSNVAGKAHIIILANVAQRAHFCVHKQRSGQSNHSTPCLCIMYYN